MFFFLFYFAYFIFLSHFYTNALRVLDTVIKKAVKRNLLSLKVAKMQNVVAFAFLD